MERRLPKSLSAVQRHRLVDEWANGVELYDVPSVESLIECGRRVPVLRTAVRHGGHILTYAELFARLDGGVIGTAGPSLDGLAELLCDIAEATQTDSTLDFGASGISLTPDALAAAADDRRAVVADHREARIDRAFGSADVRLFATRWDCADAAVELLAALADGATLVLATAAQRTDPAALAELISTCAATHVVAPAGILSGLADRPAPALPSVRRWDVTGTACSAVLSGLLRTISPGSVAGFAYSAPEYAGVAARGPLDGSGRVRPIPGARLLVLDETLRVVAPGTTGDVYLGGAALAAATPGFVADPFAAGNLCSTGARGHWTADGWLVFDAVIAARVSERISAAADDEVGYAA
ncbi:AMP-binding protein [Nocardia sp. SYP-A9097]|uniref:AMP-binding protein n=1 Tax=Nocardia sp. SYP-A9097 TaxID=2663237 RepID=UPI00129A11EE|nr:AMP-binding protein [Nocardia sp. SYP-A9097]MRH91591.1 AMP-binding protein [Nocardia sp. SYP-A9097]